MLGGAAGGRSASAAHGAGGEPPGVLFVLPGPDTLEREHDEPALSIHAGGGRTQRLPGAPLHGGATIFCIEASGGSLPSAMVSASGA